MDNCKSVKEQSPIEKEITQVFKNLGDLECIISELQGRLKPIAVESVPCKADPAVTPYPLYPIGAEIRKIANLISDQTERIREQIDRLQL